jgi:hypothetical protein
MDTLLQPGIDRVRENTPQEINEKIDRQIEYNISYYRTLDPVAIRSRISELDEEWDIERVLQLNAAVIAFTGLLFGVFKNKIWLLLPLAVTAFLAQHAVQGWCPPIPLFRKLGVRTRKEIDKERYALIEILKDRTTDFTPPYQSH